MLMPAHHAPAQGAPPLPAKKAQQMGGICPRLQDVWRRPGVYLGAVVAPCDHCRHPHQTRLPPMAPGNPITTRRLGQRVQVLAERLTSAPEPALTCTKLKAQRVRWSGRSQSHQPIR